MREYIDNWMKIVKQLDNFGVFECKNKKEIKKKIKEMRDTRDADRQMTAALK